MSTTRIPKTMKAIRASLILDIVSETGGPDVLSLDEIPVPTAEDHEVLIKVEWTGTNYIDNSRLLTFPYKRSGLFPVQLPFTLGHDAVGTIVSLPKVPMAHTSLPPLQVGLRVLTCRGSAFAEYMVAPWWQVAPLPEGIDPKEGVAMATTEFTSMYLLRGSYKVKKGDWLCKYFGANVIGTTSTPEKAELAKANGADHVLLTTASSEDNIAAIKKLTGKGVHVVYDSVGRDTWEEDFEVVRPKATIVSFGNSSGPVPAFEPLKLFAKALKVTRPTLGPFMVEPEDFALYATEIFDIVKKGGLKFSIYKVYPFTAEGVAQTQLDITSRSTTGKLIIHVSD
ncbi:hypothetical protein EHS25_006967 [Saitozyma podzolica]|uniref:Enoyl reductase (ER) domain-containing protein n=1 Tax=Saitozyma podzolica TaxID=1890683 RepID=A0A427XPP6_9TREE|nr:hypothetical protein EHS25_006967 [Saitozyma podzolica]